MRDSFLCSTVNRKIELIVIESKYFLPDEVSFSHDAGMVLAAYNPRSVNAFRIKGRIVTYLSRISLHLSAKLVVHSRVDPAWLSM